MPLEQSNQYIEKAKLNEPISDQLINEIMKDPSKFDEDKIRKEYTAKLDQARGGKMIESASLLKKYAEAQQKIEENIRKIKEVVNYALQKDKAFKAIDTIKKISKVDNGIKSLYLQMAFADLKAFKDMKVTNLYCHIDREINLKNVDAAMKNVNEKLDPYFTKYISNVGEKEINAVKSAEKGNLDFVLFTDIRYELSELKSAIADKFIGTSQPEKMVKAAQDRLFVLEAYYNLAMEKLGKYDRSVVANLDAAEGAAKSKTKGARAWEAGASELYFMNLEKGVALNKKQQAADRGAAGGLFSPGDEMFKQAMDMSIKSYSKAAELFKKAGQRYELASQIAFYGSGEKAKQDLAKRSAKKQDKAS
jgi:hypothetical protein